jgi:hypothetical protein
MSRPKDKTQLEPQKVEREASAPSQTDGNASSPSKLDPYASMLSRFHKAADALGISADEREILSKPAEIHIAHLPLKISSDG